MGSGKDLFAVPMFDDQHTLRILWIVVHTDAMAGGVRLTE